MKKKEKAETNPPRLSVHLKASKDLISQQEMFHRWLRHPSGYAVIKESGGYSIGGLTAKNCESYIAQYYLPHDIDILEREMQKIMRAQNGTSKSFAASIVIVPEGVVECKAWKEFVRGAAVYGEVQVR